MVMKKILLALGLAFYIISVGAVEEQRIEANFTGFEANKINSQYMPRPTFAKLRSMQANNGSKALIQFEMDSYSSSISTFGVATEFIDENIEVIQKYLEWALMAKERGDLLDKDIATVKGFDVGPFYEWNSYQFHSGNKESHYLVITEKIKMLGFFQRQEDNVPITVNEENANLLIKRLLEFKEGKITLTKTDDYK